MAGCSGQGERAGRPEIEELAEHRRDRGARVGSSSEKQRFASRPDHGALCGDDFHPLDDGAPDAGVPHGGDPVVALVDGHVVWVVVVDLDACAGSEQEDEPGLVVLGADVATERPAPLTTPQGAFLAAQAVRDLHMQIVGDGDVAEVGEVIADNAAAELVDRFVLQVIQRGVEKADNGRDDHLAHVQRPGPVRARKAAQRHADAGEQRLPLVKADHDVVRGKPDVRRLLQNGVLKPLQVGDHIGGARCFSRSPAGYMP